MVVIPASGATVPPFGLPECASRIPVGITGEYPVQRTYTRVRLRGAV